MMKLMTTEIEDKLSKYPIGSTDGQGKNAEVIVKYFNPCGAVLGLSQKEKSRKTVTGYCSECAISLNGNGAM